MDRARAAFYSQHDPIHLIRQIVHQYCYDMHQFGFLPIKKSLPFGGGELVLLPEYEEMADILKKATHKDGLVYPPMEQQSRAVPKISDGKILPEALWDWQAVPNTERP